MLLGTNLGQRERNLQQARAYIAESAGCIVSQSALFRTASWGIEAQPDFLNQALCIHSALAPETLLDEILDIELRIGRIRRLKWASRLIDIDILFYGRRRIQTPRLQVPHPFLPQRNFALAPLLDIAPDLVHPESGLTVSQLFRRSPDPLPAVALPSFVPSSS